MIEFAKSSLDKDIRTSIGSSVVQRCRRGIPRKKKGDRWKLEFEGRRMHEKTRNGNRER